ncbi:LysR family transcriptional regulator [Metabacillus fastidiosus]|uniref:LysR family transcriptional regulator n=1 Tax=Metabacillus fastidiosus TaxID=1458 RepID=UPI002E23B2E6|nr:LysR family transcriptional regulator [Metabacillus fastidiosus]
MNFQQLKIFVSTAQTGKLIKTAELLNLKQPTVTFHLNRLQENLGVPLFTQTSSRNWKLTDAGEALYYYAMQIVHLAEESERTMKEYKSLQRGNVSFGASYTPASYILPPYLANFQKQYEEVHISLMVKKAPSILEKVKNYELDLGVIAYGKLQDNNLSIIPIIEDKLVLIMHPDHPLNHMETIRPTDLIPFPFILHEKNSVSRRLTEKWALENNIELTIRMEIGSIQTIKESIASNIGLSIVPKLSVEREIKEGRLVAKSLPNYINERFIYIIYRKNQLLTPLMEKFMSFLTISLKELNKAVK